MPILIVAVFATAQAEQVSQQVDQTVLEIEAGCHPLIMAQECNRFREALRRTSGEGREHILADYLATLQERQADCRCDQADKRVAWPPR